MSDLSYASIFSMNCPHCGHLVPIVACQHCYCINSGYGNGTVAGPPHMTCCKCGDRRASVVSCTTNIQVTGGSWWQ